MPRRLPHFATATGHLLQRSGIPAHPRLASGIAAGIAASALTAYLIVRSRRPSPEELERRRRAWLSATGRLTDGAIVDARTFAGDDHIGPAPDVLLYRYRFAGVTYDCAQDVSALPTHTSGFRLDQPIQVRYDPRNPGNSIVVSEHWSGLRMAPQRFLPFDPNTHA